MAKNTAPQGEQAMAEVMRNMNDISAATRAQSDGVGHVNDGILRLDGMTSHNDVVVLQFSDAAHKLNVRADRGREFAIT